MLIIARSANGYVLRQMTTQPEGVDSITFQISLAGTAATVDQSDGASSIRYTARVAADTIVYVADILVDNQGLVSTQSGRLFVSQGGRVLTDVNQLVASGETIDQQLVFDRQR
jgi:hypothetical protein